MCIVKLELGTGVILLDFPHVGLWRFFSEEGESIPAGRKHGCTISRNVKPYSYQCLSPPIGKAQTVKQAMTLPIINELRGSI